MFGIFIKKSKILTVDMITRDDQPISTTGAKAIFKQRMLDIGYLGKDELNEHVVCLSNEIKGHEQYLKDEVTNTKEEIQEAKNELANLKKKLTTCHDDEKEEIEDGIKLLEGELVIAAVDMEKATNNLAEFKKDKRAFLVDYINTQIHGDDWMSKLRSSHKKATRRGNVFFGR